MLETRLATKDGRRLVLFGAVALGVVVFASTPVALALGVFFAMVFKTPAPTLVNVVAKKLLPLCVVGLGAGMNLGVVASVGLHTIVPTFLSIAFCFALGALLAKRLRLDKELALLLSAGTAICGGSAIAATSTAMGAKEHHTTVALSTIFVLNGVALVVFPSLGHALAMSPEAFGAFAALAIHDTSSVVGAAAQYDDGGIALGIATSTKLARAMWIVPVTLVLGAIATRRSGQKHRATFPWFILGFVAIAAVATYLPGGAPIGAFLSDVAKRGLSLVLFLVGAQLSLDVVRRTGKRPVAFATLLWLAMCALSFVLVRAFSLGQG